MGGVPAQGNGSGQNVDDDQACDPGNRWCVYIGVFQGLDNDPDLAVSQQRAIAARDPDHRRAVMAGALFQ